MTVQQASVQRAHLSHLSQLDHLRPPPDWKTDYAVLSTYSAHTSVMAAVLLALSGAEDEQGSGSKIGFARAITELRGKVHFVLQTGRLSPPKVVAPIVALLDQFILQVPWNEGPHGGELGRSWHAKFAIVRHVPQSPDATGERWVFMLGSRNLTLDMSWDIGLVLKTVDEHIRDQKTSPQTIAGIGQIAVDLADLFPDALNVWRSFAKNLGAASWQVPQGLDVAEIRLVLPDTPSRALPKPAAGIQRVLAVSPFLDGGAVAEVSAWGGEAVTRQLVSTRMAFEKISMQSQAKLQKFDALLSLPAPDHEVLLGSEGNSEEERIAADQMGLHAKILYVESAKGGSLWMGSPNLTSRAWTRNAECYAQINILHPISAAGKLLRDGLDAFVDMATPVSLDAITGLDNEVSTEQRLSDARAQVSARLTGSRQSMGSGQVLLISALAPPHPDDLDVFLSCGPLTGQLNAWQRNKDRLSISGYINSASASDCVRIRLSLAGLDTEWLQLIPWNPPLGEERDAAVLSDYLGPRQMLSWIHEVLNGFSNGDEGGSWDSPAVKTKYVGGSPTTALGLPSIEQALRIWLKDKSQFEEVDHILQICSQKRKAATQPLNVEEQLVDSHLKRFTRSWNTLRKGLRKDVL